MKRHRHRIGHREVPQSASPRAAVLRDLLAAAELNYVRLLALFPDLRCRDEAAFVLPDAGGRVTDVALRVLERGPFTTLLAIRESGGGPDWLAPMTAEIRLSHDARVAEVVTFHGHRRLLARYPYPNPAMRQPDEKLQVNRQFGEWLEHCRRWGAVNDGIPCPA